MTMAGLAGAATPGVFDGGVLAPTPAGEPGRGAVGGSFAALLGVAQVAGEVVAAAGTVVPVPSSTLAALLVASPALANAEPVLLDAAPANPVVGLERLPTVAAGLAAAPMRATAAPTITAVADFAGLDPSETLEGDVAGRLGSTDARPLVPAMIRAPRAASGAASSVDSATSGPEIGAADVDVPADPAAPDEVEIEVAVAVPLAGGPVPAVRSAEARSPTLPVAPGESTLPAMADTSRSPVAVREAHSPMFAVEANFPPAAGGSSMPGAAGVSRPAATTAGSAVEAFGARRDAGGAMGRSPAAAAEPTLPGAPSPPIGPAPPVGAPAAVAAMGMPADPGTAPARHPSMAGTTAAEPHAVASAAIAPVVDVRPAAETGAERLAAVPALAGPEARKSGSGSGPERERGDGAGSEAGAPAASGLAAVVAGSTERARHVAAVAAPPGEGPQAQAPAQVSVASERLGAVRVGLEGGPQDLRVSLALAPSGAWLVAAEAPRLVAELAAQGVRVQSLDIGGGGAGGSATGSPAGGDGRPRGGSPAGPAMPGSAYAAVSLRPDPRAIPSDRYA